MARSSGFPVCLRSPSLCCRIVAATRTPLPTSRPEGARVDAPVGAPAARSCWYMRSWNSARPFLKPAVETLAMLLAVTSRRVSCASIPVAAVESALIILRPLSRGSDVLSGALVDLLVALDHPVQRLVVARDLDHVDDAADDVEVALLDGAGEHLRHLADVRLGAGRGGEQGAALVDDVAGREARELERADLLVVGVHGAVGGDAHLLGALGHVHRAAALRPRGEAVRVDDATLWVELELARARVANPARRVDGKKPVARERQVERVAGLLDRAGRRIATRRGHLHEGRVLGLRLPERLGEGETVRAEAGRPGIRHVVRHHVQGRALRHGAAQCNVDAVSHQRSFSTSAISARRRASAREWSWQTRDSLTPRTSPIST